MNTETIRLLADFTVGHRPLPPQFQEAATAAVLDTLAVMIAGSADDGFAKLTQAIGELQDTSRGLSATDSAILNGFASHVLDYDDVSMLCVCHPSAPVLSALVAHVLSARGPTECSGTRFLESFAIGTEVMIRLGQVLGFRHYQLGFHPTATLGAIGAAAAVASLEGLDLQRCTNALSIAASMASGLKKNFGSEVKPLHVGLAASSGLRAARMAQSGLNASSDVFDEGGYLHAFSGGLVDRWPDDIVLGMPLALIEPGFESKRYPCCYLLHKAVEGVLALRRRAGLGASNWLSVRLYLPAGSNEALIHPYPRTGLTAKFSAPYAVVAALLDGEVNLSTFTDVAVLRNEVQARLHSVKVVELGCAESGLRLGAAPVEIEVLLADGSRLVQQVTASPGSNDDPLTERQRLDKWLDCLHAGRPLRSEQAAGALFEKGKGLASLENVLPWLREVFDVACNRTAP